MIYMEEQDFSRPTSEGTCSLMQDYMYKGTETEYDSVFGECE